MKANFVNIVFVVDESGSMADSRSDVIGGFNTFIKEQKKQAEGQLNVSLYMFNSKIKAVYKNRDIAEVEDLSEKTYCPCGTTALNDAIGTAITETGKTLNSWKEEDRPSTVMVVVMTDGYENDSKHYSLKQVREMIKHQEERYSWKFIYIGSELDDSKQADDLGFSNQAYTGRGMVQDCFNRINKSAVRYRICPQPDLLNRNNLDEELVEDLHEMTREYEKQIGKKIVKNK